MQKGAGEQGKAVRNKTQLVNSIGKSRWELRRGAGGGWCNLGDGDKEPGAEGAQCRGGRREGNSAQGLGRDGWEPLPKAGHRAREWSPWRAWRDTKRFCREAVSGRGSRRVRQVRQRGREARWEDKGREAGRRWWCRSKRKDQTGTWKSMDKSCTQAAPQPELSIS